MSSSFTLRKRPKSKRSPSSLLPFLNQSWYQQQQQRSSLFRPVILLVFLVTLYVIYFCNRIKVMFPVVVGVPIEKNNDNNNINNNIPFGTESSGTVHNNPVISPECRHYGVGENPPPVVGKVSATTSQQQQQSIINQQQIVDSTDQKSGSIYRIFCTSSRRKIKWGSYQLRCRDLKVWAERCVKNTVQISTDISYEDIERRLRRKWWSLWYWWGQIVHPQPTALLSSFDTNDAYRDVYDATIFIKSIPQLMLPMYGRMYIDMVDEYGYTEDDIPSKNNIELILQTYQQGWDIYPHHNFSVVEHWYNSYPSDMERIGDPEYIPMISNSINNNSTTKKEDVSSSSSSDTTLLKIASIWNTRRGHEPTEGGCPHLPSSITDVSYDCIDKDFNITTWFVQYYDNKNKKNKKKDKNKKNQNKNEKGYRQDDDIDDRRCYMEHTLADEQLGQGRLYYDIFRQYDVLVVLAKNDTMKLQYGNVQRAVSQMRSGVPVLLEVRGPVFEDFVTKYGYTCAFQRYPNEGGSSSTSTSTGTFRGSGNDSDVGDYNTQQQQRRTNYWTFGEAVEYMKDADHRRDCQRQGLEIVKDYSPSSIGHKFLRAVGYEGPFLC